MDFKKYLEEAKEKTAVMAFGRFNPPTVGHEKLIQKVKEVSDEHNASGHVFASHTELKSKDPLPQAAKIGYLNQIAHGTQIHGSSKEEPTFLHAAAKLYKQGHKHLVMIAGSDRINDYKSKLEQYNDGKDYPHGKYKFKSIQVVSSGERDPDAEGVEGMSGTKMRNLARTNKVKQFEKGLPVALQDKSKEIVNHIKAIKEDYENPNRFDDGTPEGTAYMMKMTPNKPTECVTGVWSEKLGMCVSVREAYMNNEIFKLNDIVEATNGDRGPVVYRGSGYVTIKLNETKTVKHWLKDIQEAGKVWPEITIKPARKVLENKLPALLMSKEKLVEMHNSGMELEYMGYQTQFLHMCESASAQLKELVGKTGLNPKYILQAIQATDKYLEIEKLAIKEGFANDQMVHDFNMYLAIAHDTLNMLGYPDKELMYMTKHIKTISDLNLHKDTNYANEIISTVPTFGSGDANEGYNASDYKIVIGKDGQEYKIRSTRVVTDKNADGKPDGGVPVKETITMSKLRKKIAETYTPDPATVNRDVNMSSDKEVYHGLDKTIDGIGHEGKPVGMVSFKSFLATPETQKIESDKTSAMQDVHRAKSELAVHSSAYKLMKKAHQQDN